MKDSQGMCPRRLEPRLKPPTPERSKLMGAIRGKGNKTTELSFMQLCREARITGWRRHLPLPGRPDFAFPQKRVAVFLDGCFWHGCPKCYKPPARNPVFWAEKAARNRRRDRKVDRLLREDGWTVVRVWEHALRSPESVLRRVAHLK